MHPCVRYGKRVYYFLNTKKFWKFQGWCEISPWAEKLLSVLLFSFIQAISIAPLQVNYYSEVLPTQLGYCLGVSCRSATGNCEWRICPRSLLGGQSWIWTHDPSDERRQIYQWATISHKTLLKQFCEMRYISSPINTDSVVTRIICMYYYPVSRVLYIHR